MVLGRKPAWHWLGPGPEERASPEGSSVAWPLTPGVPVLEKLPLGISLMLPNQKGLEKHQ